MALPFPMMMNDWNDYLLMDWVVGRSVPVQEERNNEQSKGKPK